MLRKKVRWEEMFVDELEAAQAGLPLVFVPYGLCEPHGPHNALGLDIVKAHELCVLAAKEHGGVVAPPTYWHVHETGYHAAWAHSWIGSDNPFLTSLPPWLAYKLLLYQLRAFAARGFRAAIVVTGHYGGNQQDLRLVAEVFMRHSPMRVWAGADSELITHPTCRGDHAGITETSQLWYLRPDLVDVSRLTPRDAEAHRFAAGSNALEATRRLGEEIVRGQIESLAAIARGLLEACAGAEPPSALDFDQTEAIWREVEARWGEWVTLKRWESQEPVPEGSPWRANERPKWPDE